MSIAAFERFVAGPGARRRAVVRLIRSARRRLALSIFRCDDEAVLDALVERVRHGVSVRVVMTGRAKGSGRDLDRLHAALVGAGVDVRRGPPGIKYHAKYVIADDDQALVGSLNFTRRCFERTCDFLVVTGDQDVVAGLCALFDADWNGRRIDRTTLLGSRLIVGPEHAPRARFAALLRSARRRIRLIDAKLSDPRIVALLDERCDAGVSVEIRRGGDLGPLRPHGKLLVLDDETAVVGSMALSPAGLQGRRELAVVIRDSGVLAQIETFWRSLPGRRATVPAGLSHFCEARP